MRRRWWAMAAVLALSACETPSSIPPPAPAPPAAPAPRPPAQAPAPPPPAPAPAPRPPAPTTPTPSLPPPDACGASKMQRFVGRPRTEIPVPLDPSRQRVACTTCPVTLDYRPERLNFFFDAQTGIIREVKCG